MIGGIGNVLFSTYAQTSNGQDPVLTSGDPLQQAITPRGPLSVSIKNGDQGMNLTSSYDAAQDEQKNTIFLDKKCEVLFSETVFL